MPNVLAPKLITYENLYWNTTKAVAVRLSGEAGFEPVLPTISNSNLDLVHRATPCFGRTDA